MHVAGLVLAILATVPRLAVALVVPLPAHTPEFVVNVCTTSS